MFAYLLDTNVVSEISKPRPNRNVETAIQRYRHECALSALTVEELAFGVSSMTLPAQRHGLEMWLEAMLTRFKVIPYDYECALWLGKERARLRAAGYVLPRHADFARFSGLRVENWFKD
jgi:tRNA(fMet)-specific endonuclease VapC